MERREHPRLDIELRCLAWRPRQQGTPVEVITRNIGRGGMLIEWSSVNGDASPPLLDENLEIEVALPVSQGYGPRCIHCRGNVMRILPQVGHGALIALRIKDMKFRPLASAFEGAHRGAVLASLSGVGT